jgi:hypothetical protein
MALPTASTPVAKSLHTITVLQQMAIVMYELGGFNDPEAAMDAGMARLGLAGRPDPYGLRARALANLEKVAG